MKKVNKFYKYDDYGKSYFKYDLIDNLFVIVGVGGILLFIWILSKMP